MIGRDEHLALRGRVYAAHSEYAQACAAYWGAVPPNRAPEALTPQIQAVRTTASTLETALRALLAFLGGLEQTEEIRGEHERNTTVLRLLARELALLPADG